MTPEGRVKEGIKRWLRDRGWWYFLPVSNGMGRHGILDFVVCRPVVVTPDMVGKTVGVFGMIEAKAAGKRGNVSALQHRTISEVHQHGGFALVVDDPVQLDVLEG